MLFSSTGGGISSCSCSVLPKMQMSSCNGDDTWQFVCYAVYPHSEKHPVTF